ncbi:galactose-binding domain-like protein [Peziza echinospora]|nr:galactose-binding domain-like protein [Peziza echinospora]
MDRNVLVSHLRDPSIHSFIHSSLFLPFTRALFHSFPPTNTTTDLISASLGGTIHSFSDEYFADATNLLTPTPPIQRPGHFVHSGAWYDGWETRRHNPEDRDWVVVKLGVPSGKVVGVEIDTAFFNGNHAPTITVEGANVGFGGVLTEETKWDIILPKQECGPSQRHFWVLERPTDRSYTHVKLSQYPDGGIARFRLYGTVTPIFPSDPNSIIDLAHVTSGGLVTSFSDAHFGKATNLLLPGRGINMGDGWETKRSRTPGHVDWVIVRLGAPGTIEEVVVDTAHYRGNFPREVRIEGLDWRAAGAAGGRKAEPGVGEAEWRTIVAGERCSADREHAYPSTKLLGCGEGRVFTHVKMTIVPDGGVKRLRVFGRRVVA